MKRLERIMASVENILSNKRKRHIMGGALLSASLLFAGLVFTILSLKLEEGEEENNVKRISE